jgi:hypothetical protein
MKLLNLIDKWWTFDSQKNYLFSFLFIGLPFGYFFTQGLLIVLKGWYKYHFDIFNMLFLILFDCLIVSPIIINYFRHKNKYNDILKKLYSKHLEEKNTVKVKAKFNYESFIKGQSYYLELANYDLLIDNIYIIDEKNYYHSLKRLINKFELDDIKEQRKLKLEKLKKLW